MHLVGKYGIKFLDDKLKGIFNTELVIIGAHTGCVDCETEFLSENGWKKISDFIIGDRVMQYDTKTNIASLVYPERYIKEPCGEMISIKSKYGINQKLSYDHNFLYVNTSGKYIKTKAIDFANEYFKSKRGHIAKIPTTFDIEEKKGIDLTDAQIKVMLAIIADGYFPKKRKQVVLHLKKERKIIELIKILNEANISYKVSKQPYGYKNITFYAPRVEKKFTSFWYGCSKKQLQLICDNVLKWDGSSLRNRKSFFTTIKESADFIQYAFTACGKRATIKVDDRTGRIREVNGKEYITHSIDYRVLITDRTLPSCISSKKDIVSFCESTDGYKYCFTVPTSNLVLRREGSIFITGNCGKSTVANMIALNLANQGVKPALLSLENFKGDMLLKETFKQWKLDNAPSNPQLWGVDFRDWLAQYGDAPQAAGESYKTITQKFKGMLIIERPEGQFTIETLEKYFKDAANQGCGCVILDHLDYLDYLNATENDISHVRAIMGKIRNLQTEFNIPVIAFSQFRKGISQDVKIPSYEELYGSGDKAKQAVVVVVLARDNENQLYADDVSPTFMAIRKDRYGDHKACRVMYDLKRQCYADDYQNLKVNFWGTEIKEV